MNLCIGALIEYQETPLPSFEDLHSLIRTRIVSILSDDDFNYDDDHKDEIRGCLAVLEELYNEENYTEELNAVLSCLYTLSKINGRKQKRPKKVSDKTSVLSTLFVLNIWNHHDLSLF